MAKNKSPIKRVSKAIKEIIIELSAILLMLIGLIEVISELIKSAKNLF